MRLKLMSNRKHQCQRLKLRPMTNRRHQMHKRLKLMVNKRYQRQRLKRKKPKRHLNFSLLESELT